MSLNNRTSLTQIVLRQTENEYVIGWIKKERNPTNDACRTFKSSMDGVNWSETFSGFNTAIKHLLVQTGHKKKDFVHVIPKPELYPDLWIYPKFTV